MELLKIHVPENMLDTVRMKYNIEINDNSIEAKDEIMDSQIFRNSRSRSEKRKKKKKKTFNDSISDYGARAGSRTSGMKNKSSCGRMTSVKTNASSHLKIAKTRKSRHPQLSKGSRTAKSSSKGYVKESHSTYLSLK